MSLSLSLSLHSHTHIYRSVYTTINYCLLNNIFSRYATFKKYVIPKKVLLLSSLTLCHQPLKVLPSEVLLSESGELTDLGRSYVPPRVLLEALCVICSAASHWGDPTEAEDLAMEILIITHHPSLGIALNTVSLLLTVQSDVYPLHPQL